MLHADALERTAEVFAPGAELTACHALGASEMCDLVENACLLAGEECEAQLEAIEEGCACLF